MLEAPPVRNIAYLVAIVVVIAAAASQAFDLARAGQLSMIVWIGVPTLALAIVGVVRAQRDGMLYRRGAFDEGEGPHYLATGKGWLNVRSGDFTRGFLAAAVLFGGSWVFTKVVMPVGSARESWIARLYLQLGDPTTLRKNVAVVAVAIVVMSIAEELVWRGLVTSLLEEKVGTRRAWVWAAVLYAVAHVPTVWALRDPVAGPNPMILVAALGCGLVWGYMARRFERLLPGIFSHVLFDWTVLMMFRLWGPSV